MIAEIFQGLLIMSAIGSILTMILLLLKHTVGKSFSPTWQYYVWLLVLLIMILPVSFSLPGSQELSLSVPWQTQSNATDIQQIEQNKGAIQSEQPNDPVETQTEVHTVTDELSVSSVDWMTVLGWGWLVGVLLYLAKKLLAYKAFCWELGRSAEPFQEDIVDNIGLSIQTTALIDSPLMVGLLRPVLYLPQMEISQEELHYIILHEMTHYRRHDLWYKWFAMVVNALHWFNPIAYFISREIEEACEISCDYAVTASMDMGQKNAYMKTILSLLSRSKARLLTTQMASNKTVIKRRFTMIRLNQKTNRFISVISVMLAAVLFSGSVFASGALRGNLFESSDIQVSSHGEILRLTHKPYVENGEVYLPLRELLVAEGIDNDDITYDSGCVRFLVPGENIIYRQQHYDYWINRVRIGTPYFYMAGHSEGSTENASMQLSPVIKDRTTYVPYEFFERMKYSGQGIFEDLSVTVSGQPVTVSGSIYSNYELDFSIPIPASWNGKYIIEETKDSVIFYQKSTFEKYGSGMLFYIERLEGDQMKEYTPETDMFGRELLHPDVTDSNRIYVLGRPTDVQYPIWTDHDDEDVAIAQEYEMMAQDIGYIQNHFERLETPLGESQGNTIYGFFEAFSQSDFETMKQYCTASCVRESFKTEGSVFGMEQAKLQSLYVDPLELAKSSNDFNVTVSVEGIPAPHISYFGETMTFTITLMRQEDGSYLIDKFTM